MFGRLRSSRACSVGVLLTELDMPPASNLARRLDSLTPPARPRRALIRLGVLLAALHASPALAQPSDADRATARALATEGHEALVRKDFAIAEDRFRRADALVHAPTLVVDHARALVGLGRLAQAYRRYDLVIREGVAANAPWAWKRAIKEAEREIQALKPRLAWLTVRVKGPTDPIVTVNDEPVAATELGTTRAVDPGTSTVRVTAEGYVAKEAKVDIDPEKTAEVEVALEPEPVAAAVQEEPPPAPPPPVRRAPPPKPRDDTLAFVALGVSGVGLATGIVTGILALGKRSDIASECPDLKCDPQSQREKDRLEDEASSYRTLGTISGVGFGLGVAAGGVGVALLLMDQNNDPSDGDEASVRPYVTPTSVGVLGRF